MRKEEIIQLFWQKFKFAGTSSVATAVDYCLYLVLVHYTVFEPVVSHVISAGTGMVINFLLQRRYIFELRRKISSAFLISLLTSVIGIGLGAFFIYLLNLEDFFRAHQFITKAIVTGTIFFYNFYMKRFAFENKLF